MNADIRWIDNPEIFRVNQIAAHSDHDYFTNYEALNSNSHNLIQSLNGQWKFCFSRNAMSRPADFYKEDYDTSYFDKIMVPGHIELAGYDQIRYINTLYPWEGKTYRRGAYSIESAGDGTGMFSEAEYNPVGSYIKKFDLAKELCGKRVRLFFEGVEQAMYVWLNGEFIGYAEDSFTPSEFDLTPYIREKDNVLAVEIHKMCSAAFLEDQDFFRFFGIFRNVSLRALPEAHVEDMWLNPVLNEDNVSGTLNTNIRVSATENQDVCARIILKNVDDQVILERNIELEDKDIRVDIYHASGAGGQHVNKTASAVRLTHLPTGIVVAMQDERSQLKNREKAMKVLRARVYDKISQEAQSEYDANRKSAVGTGDRSERIRTYNFPQNRVTDHRIGLTLQKLDQVLAGKIDEIVDALILYDHTEKLEQLNNGSN